VTALQVYCQYPVRFCVVRSSQTLDTCSLYLLWMPTPVLQIIAISNWISLRCNVTKH